MRGLGDLTQDGYRWWAVVYTVIIFGSHEMRGNPWLAEQLLASKEGLCCMELGFLRRHKSVWPVCCCYRLYYIEIHDGSVAVCGIACLSNSIEISPFFKNNLIVRGGGAWCSLNPLRILPASEDRWNNVECEWNDNWKGNIEVLGEKPVPLQRWAPQIPRGFLDLKSPVFEKKT